MCDVRMDLSNPEAGTDCGQDGPTPEQVKSQCAKASVPDLPGLRPPGPPSSADMSPSPSAEASGLLSLPWEMLTNIASHLPAQCVIDVLPKVCHALESVGKDSTAWQLRAGRLIGSRAGFPVGPREDFDWPSACVEMEQLITCWTGQAYLKARQAQEEEVERERMRQMQDGTLNPLEEGARPRNQENGGPLEMDGHEPPRSPSPPLALEYMPLPSGHIAQVNSVLLMGGDGSVLATGSRDWNVKLWDLQAGSGAILRHTLGGQGDFSTHRGWVWCLSSLSHQLASGGFDSTVRLWDLQAGGAKTGLIRAGAAVLCLSYQSDVLLAGMFDKRVNMYDPRAAQPLVKSIRLHGHAVMCLAADDKYIISGSKDCTIAVFDRRGGKDLKRIQLSSYLQSMSYRDCEVWAGDNSGMIHAFSMQAGTLCPISKFNVGHAAMITGIHRSAGSLYTCSSDRTVKVHIPCAPPRTLCTHLHEAGVNGLSVEAGVFAVASGHCVEVWRPRK
ncbi:F-box/WD repeat-containing protein 9 [Cheilinus undulatus]|uniref:F-box/WD repeat-containing protein 9 n=1 Tax=Cheilinus undulatus TaxID=241271 RepID=UPI001BD3FDF8|nr:F-box/WD repeat-containing protein 9 [Cheilinus undulatus]XP_041634555.1 F-box/WD repeat-containing protein 9 [Cheilinus undulatus]